MSATELHPVEQYSLQDAQSQLRQLIADAQQGKTVLILDDQNRPIQLVPVETGKTRKAGSARGQIHMADDFDAPLADFEA
jgi:antitoxin (DNA-binding transcriptional repressor) of toxin-antitoxin stability system